MIAEILELIADFVRAFFEGKETGDDVSEEVED